MLTYSVILIIVLATGKGNIRSSMMMVSMVFDNKKLGKLLILISRRKRYSKAKPNSTKFSKGFSYFFILLLLQPYYYYLIH